MSGDGFAIRPVGVLRSRLTHLDAAPRQGDEGGSEAWIELDPGVARAAADLSAGDEILVLTWLHRADRDVLEVRPRGNPKAALTGVFATRSPDRPNPIGLHRVTVLEIDGTRIKVAPIETIDGTPVVDLKPVLGDPADR